MSNLSYFYREARGRGFERDLSVAGRSGGGVPAEYADLSKMNLLSPYTRGFLRFLARASLVMNFKAVGQYFYVFSERFVEIRSDRVKGMFERVLKKNNGLSKFMKKVSPKSTATATDGFWDDINTMNGLSSEGISLFGNSNDSRDGMLVLAKEDPEKVEDTKEDSEEKNFESTKKLISERLVKHFLSTGNVSDAGLTKNQLFFASPDFVSAWCSKSIMLVDSYLAVMSDEDRKKGKVDTFKINLSELLKSSDESAKEKDKYFEELTKIKKEGEDMSKKVKKFSNTINKQAIIRMADDFSKSYYKDALKGSNDDPLLKEFYSGMKDFYEEKHPVNDSRTKKDLMGFFYEGSDITSDSHKDEVYLSKSLGKGGLVENGHQSKTNHVDVARSIPSGNFRNK